MTATAIREYLLAAVARQLVKSGAQRMDDRYEKFRRIGSFTEKQQS